MTNIEKFNIASNLVKKGDFVSAEKIYFEILKSEPNNYHALTKLGYTKALQKDYPTAEKFLEVSFDSGHELEALKILAFVKEKLMHYDESITMLEQIIKIEPFEKYYDSLQSLYEKAQFFDEEIKISKERVEKFNSPESYKKLFLNYINTLQFDQLKELMSEIEQKFANKAFAYNLQGLYKEIIEEDIDAAEGLYQKAIKLGSKAAFYDLAVCYRKNGKYSEAEKTCSKILKDYPDKEALYYLYATIFFTEKKMHKGYKYYAERSDLVQHAGLKNPWDGKAYPDEVLLVMAEQGFGDSIMMARYFKFLTDKFSAIKVAVPDELVDLFSTNFEQIQYSNIEVIPLKNLYEINYDKYVLMLNLPYYLNISFHNIPSPEGYLHCNELKYDYFKNQYFDTDKLKVGLCWEAKGKGMRGAAQRTVDIDIYLKNLFGIECVQYYSLQKDGHLDEKSQHGNLIDLSPDLDSFEDTAAALKNLDLFISVDSAPAHLAGALGVKTLLLLPFSPEWRWFDNDKRTEWYSSVEIFKQKIGENWSSATIPLIERVKEIAEKKK